MTYLTSFALLAIPSYKDSNDESVFSFNEKQREFLLALSKQLNVSSLSKLDNLCKQPHQININMLKLLLKDEKRKYTWLLDLVFLDSIKDSLGDSTSFLQDVLRMLDDYNLKIFLKDAITFFTTEKVQERGAFLLKNAPHTDGYKHIIKFYAISLENAYAQEIEQVHSRDFMTEHIEFTLETMDLSTLLLYRETAPSLLAPSESRCVKKLCSIKDNALKFLRKYEFPLCKLESMIKLFGVKIQDNCTVYSIINELTCKDCKINTYVEKDEWGDDEWDDKIDVLSTFIDTRVDQYSKLMDDYIEQIRSFERGDFTSIWEKQRQEKQEREANKVAEHKSKKQVSIILNGVEKKCSIKWENFDLSNAPFEAHTIFQVTVNTSIN